MRDDECTHTSTWHTLSCINDTLSWPNSEQNAPFRLDLDSDDLNPLLWLHASHLLGLEKGSHNCKKRFYQIYSVENKHPGMQLWRFDFILRSGVGIWVTHADSDHLPYDVKRLLVFFWVPDSLKPPATGLRQQQQPRRRPSGERSGGATAFANFQVATR